MTLNKNSELHKKIEALVKEYEEKDCRNCWKYWENYKDPNSCPGDDELCTGFIEKGDYSER